MLAEAFKQHRGQGAAEHRGHGQPGKGPDQGGAVVLYGQSRVDLRDQQHTAGAGDDTDDRGDQQRSFEAVDEIGEHGNLTADGDTG